MIKIEFTPEEIDALEYERYHHPEPKVQQKMEALYLKSQRYFLSAQLYSHSPQRSGRSPALPYPLSEQV